MIYLEKWLLRNVKANVNRLSKEFGINDVLTRILLNRGIYNKNEEMRFINPSLNMLYNPKLMKDIEKGAFIIKDAVDNNQSILIVGDYDVDGIMSTYILYEAIFKFTNKVSYYIPDRITEGYGINENIILYAKDNDFDVIITCDNGIAAVKQMEMAEKFGMKVVITDHHDVPFVEKDGEKKFVVPQADAVVNPKQHDCNYPFDKLCGAGVIFKFVQVLYEVMNADVSQSYKFLEYAAIATVCDVVDIIDENRIIVKKGLELINRTQNIGLKALINEVGLGDKEINVYSLGFVIGPTINAVGRLKHAKIALKLLLSKNEKEAYEFAKKLHEFNKERQEITNLGVEKAEEAIEKFDFSKDKVLVIYLKDIHESVAGIIAGRIREKYNVPTIVFTDANEGVKGSGRSIEEYNMFEGLVECADLIEKFGGHPMAAGLSLKNLDMVDKLRDRLNKNCNLSEDDIIPKVHIDMQLCVDNVSLKLSDEMKALEPFGKGNSKPLFADKCVSIIGANIIGKNKNVLKLKIKSSSGKIFDAIYFNGISEFEKVIIDGYGENGLKKLYSSYSSNVKLDITFNIETNEFLNNKTVQLVIKNFRNHSERTARK